MPSMANTDNHQFNNDTSFIDQRRKKIADQRRSLPIAAVEKRLVAEVSNNQTLIVVGETGSGKTTQLPQFLFKAGFCRDGKLIGVTQPRRVAATSVAERVAEECGVQLGQRVGYSIRFEDRTSNSTRIKYMTDGLLLREALLDPYLSKYSVIIVDEAHERTVHTDVLLGLLKKVQKARSQTNGYVNTSSVKANNGTLPEEEDGAQHVNTLKRCRTMKFLPLKLIIMSASLDARVFSGYFDGARAVHVQGRQFPVDVFYTVLSESDHVDAAIVAIFQVHMEEGPGDILVFLTGQEEIENIEGIVKDRLQHLPKDNRNLTVVPMFANLPSEQQKKVFRPALDGFRKVVLATNVAEASVTIPGIKFVIDPGMVKSRNYNLQTGVESLDIMAISKAQALQRSGRAGRVGPGKCFRLYPERTFEKFLDSSIPEIKRCSLSNVILQMKAIGIDDIVGFDFMEAPSRAAIIKSLGELRELGALTEDYKLSDPIGHQMARLPLDPIQAKALILANQFSCMEEMLIMVAMLSEESIFYKPREKFEELRAAVKRFSSPEGDHVTFINVFRSFDDFMKKNSVGDVKETALIKLMKKWCKENFVNRRSLRHARNVHSQLRGHIERMGLPLTSCGDDMLQFRRCLTASFPRNAALRQPNGTYMVLGSGQVVKIHPSSVLLRAKPECVVFNQLLRTTQDYILTLTRIDPSWLHELAPHIHLL